MYFSGDERGQVAAVAAALLVGFAIIGLAVAQVAVVPHQNGQVEFEHNQLAQQDVLDVRTAVLETEQTGRSQTSTVTLGTQYPERVILQNPSNPTGSLRIRNLGSVSVSNATALNPETADFWTGDRRDKYSTAIVSYSPNYNYYTSAPETDYENTVVYNEQPESESHVVKANQRLIDGDDILLALVEGSQAVTKTGTFTLDPRTLSASSNVVAVQSDAPTDPIVLRIPTELPEEQWREMLDHERVENGGHILDIDVSAGTLVVRLEPGVEYDLSMAKVGYEGSVSEPPAYITTPEPIQRVSEGGSTPITVEVRDRYNNPVSGVELRVKQPEVGHLTGPSRSSTGQVVATSDENGQATFTYHAPLNVPEEDALSTFGVVAPGIAGPKGEVEFAVGVLDTPEPVDDSRTSPLITAVEPAPDASELDAEGDGEYVRVSVRQPVDTTNWTLDLENRDRSVVNTLELDTNSLGVGEEIYAEDESLAGSVDLNDVTDGEVTLYFVGPTVSNLSGFVENNSLGQNDEFDVVVNATAVREDGLENANDGILDDRRGMVILRDAQGAVTDEFAYRSGQSGTITAVSPSEGGDSGQEYTRLDFARETPLSGLELRVESNGVRERLSLTPFPFSSVSGPLYIVGQSVDIPRFAATHGVNESRVKYAGTLETPDGLDYPGDVFGDDEAELELVDTGPTDDVTLDTYEYEDSQTAAIQDVSPESGGDSTDEYARLQFNERVDTTGWDLDVDNGSVVDTFDMSPVSGVTSRAPGPIYVVGDAVNVSAFAGAKGVSTDRVVRADDIVEGSLSDDDVFDDGGATLTLRDIAGDPVDTFDYDAGYTVAGPSTLGGEIEEVSPLAGGNETREYTRLDFDQPTHTTDWVLTVTTEDGTVETFDLSEFNSTTGAAPGPIYLVGDSIDPVDFADRKEVRTARVAKFGQSNVLPESGAYLELVNADGHVVDTEAYGSEARPNIRWEFDLGPDATNQTAYRRIDANDDFVDTNRVSDWYTSTLDPGLVQSPAAEQVDYVDDSVRSEDGIVDLEIINRGPTETDRAAIVGFGTGTHLAVALNNGDQAEAFVASEPTPGWANDTDGKFAADGTEYLFEEGGDHYDGQDGTLNGSDTVANLSLAKYRDVDGSVAALGTLTDSTPERADLTVTLVFGDGSKETMYFRQKPADLAIDMTANQSVVKPGAGVRFTVNLSNKGPGEAPGLVEVTDKLPAGLEYASHSTSAGSYNSTTGEWQLGDGVDVGERQTLLLNATMTAPVGDTVTNVAGITASSVPDPVPGNNQDSVTISSGGADLGVNVTANRTLVEQGDRVAFLVNLTNWGPADNDGPIEVTDQLPDGLYYISHETTRGTYDPDTGVWNLDDGLEANESENLTLVAKVSLSEPTANTANITDVGPIADGNPANNSDSSEEIHVGPCSGFVEDGEEVLLYSTFETNGSDDDERLRNAGWTEGGPGDGGVNDMTSAPPKTDACDQSAYHADGTGFIQSPTLDTTGHDQVVLEYWVSPGESRFESTLPGSDDQTSAAPNSDLLVQYRTPDGTWVTVDHFDDDNDTLGGGVNRSTVIPLDDATHDGFALRFNRTQADTNPLTLGYWHVDNVQVLGSPASGDLQPTVESVVLVCEDDDGEEDNDCDDGDDDGGDDDDDCDGDDDDGDGEEDEDECLYEATFGYESTYDRTVYIREGAPGMNELTPPKYADADQPERFAPGSNDSAVVVDDLEPGENVTWTLEGDSVTAHGIDADLAVSLTADDNTTIEQQFLTFTVNLTNNGPQDNPGPIEVTTEFPISNQSDTRLEFEAAAATAGSYKSGTGVWTLPDGLAVGQTEQLDVTVVVNTSKETTSAAEVTASPTADSVPENDRDTVTIDPHKVGCGLVAFVAEDDDRVIKTVNADGNVNRLGRSPTKISQLGPFADVDEDGACEVVYLAENTDHHEGNVSVMHANGDSETLYRFADLSKTLISVGDVDEDGTPDILYADDDDQDLLRQEYGDDPLPIKDASGENVSGDSGGVGHADFTGDGANETLHIESGHGLELIYQNGTIERIHTEPDLRGHAGPALPYAGGGGTVYIPASHEDGIYLVGYHTDIDTYDDSFQTVGEGRVTYRDWDRDGEFEIVFVGTDERIYYFDVDEDEVVRITTTRTANPNYGAQ